MVEKEFLRNVLTHLVNGQLEQSLCRVCLLPVDDSCENVFTYICKEDKEYCIADVLEKLCKIEISPSENSVVCANCVVSASSAYKFYLTSKRSTEILHFYTEEIEKSMDSIDDTGESENLCFLLPLIDVSKSTYDFDLEGISLNYMPENNEGSESEESKEMSEEYDSDEVETQSDDSDESRVIITCDKGGGTEYFKQKGGILVPMEGINQKDYAIESQEENEETEQTEDGRKKRRYTIVNERKKREPMPFLSCSQCPVQYRFVSKLKSHMKNSHGIDAFFCKVCNELVEGADDFKKHTEEKHSGVCTCKVCGLVFKNIKKLEKHKKKHSEQEEDSAQICVRCGDVLPSDKAYQEHQAKKHGKPKPYSFTCHYCSKNYRTEVCFEAHLKKHEKYYEVDGEFKCPSCPATLPSSRRLSRHVSSCHAALRCSQCPRRFATQAELAEHGRTHDDRFTCEKCNRSFVDARSLMWHKRLHSDERPFPCEKCDKRFITAARRNQHALTAHSAPARRCPLCPAAFHLRSMVSTHVKKVHLAANKRRYRSGNAGRRAAPVAPQDLSVDVQQDVLALQVDADDTSLLSLRN